MYLVGPITLTVDFTLFLAVLVLGLGVLGWRRGPRAEVMTLGGVGLVALLIGWTGTRERLVDGVNRFLEALVGQSAAMAGGVISSGGQKLVLSLIVFGLAVAGMWWAGSALGAKSRPGSILERLMGSVLAALSGFAVGLTLAILGQAYAGREAMDLRVALPTLQMPVPSDRYVLVQYAPVVFLGAFLLLAVLALASGRKAKSRLR